MTLKRLDRMDDYKVADDSTDIRGWKILDSTGQEIGKIDGLLFEPDDNRVYYAIADIGDRCVLLPVGQIDLDEGNRKISARGYNRERLMALPAYRDDSFTEQHEREAYKGFHPEYQESERLDYNRETYQGGQRFQLLEEQLRVGKNREQIGEVTATKRPVSETVEEQVQLTREEPVIERHAVNRPVSGDERITSDGDTIRVPIFGEEVVTEKRPIVKEEVEISKRPTTETETVRETVRREELEFAGTEPTQADYAERERLERERLGREQKSDGDIDLFGK